MQIIKLDVYEGDIIYQSIDEHGVFNGKPGESLFVKPFLSYLHATDWNTQLPGFIQQLDKTGDERSYVITAALVVEYHLDKLLSLWIPDYSKLLRDRADFTFSLKIFLLRACRIIPPHIMRCSDCVRHVRNAFAHDLKVEAIEDVPDKTKKK